jgi:hypothetical protein
MFVIGIAIGVTMIIVVVVMVILPLLFYWYCHDQHNSICVSFYFVLGMTPFFRAR